jgi:glycosyltransferase involved in cell wall biosynthesis
MRIGIYIDVLKGELRGIGYHVYELIHSLSIIDKKNEYFLYYQRGLSQERDITRYCPKAANFHLRPVRFPKSWISEHPTVWWDYYLPFVIRADHIDVFHSPNYFLPSIPQEKSIVTIHDLAFSKMALYSKGFTKSLQYWTEKALQTAGRVIAISENSRKDIEALGVVEPERIRVIYSGSGHIVSEEEIQYERVDDVYAAFQLPRKYILFVGVLHPRKNIPFLVRSYAKLRRETQIPHGLVIAGIRGPATEDITKLIQELDIISDVTITGYVEDWQLSLLYKHADLFVFPTLYEGFGLVVLEAMHYGVPVVATDCSSIREVVGNAATLVPCNDIEAMTKAIYKLLVDSKLRRERITQGKEQAAKFSWQRCASETLSLYNEIYNRVVPF